ncbi:MAG: hypothetical protein IKS59_04290 [Aeriscardovia sp.]|nr:hypothetical protein [Aeriscardovia sp.]
MTKNSAIPLDVANTQPTLDGIAPKVRRKKKQAHPLQAASSLPIARIILNLQAEHFDTVFDYLIPEKFDALIQPGVRVRVHFGNQQVNGIVWERVDKSNTTHTLRFIDRILSPFPLCNHDYRQDITAIANYFGGTRANLLRLALPTRVAKVDIERDWTRIGHASRQACLEQQWLHKPQFQQIYQQQSTEEDNLYTNIQNVYQALTQSSQSYHEYSWNIQAGYHQWAKDIAWTLITAQNSGFSVIVVLPTHDAVQTLKCELMRLSFGYYAIFDSADSLEVRYRSYCACASEIVTCAIGTRSAMYAPLNGKLLFITLTDNCYQNTDGFAPYANVTDVARLRAQQHHGVTIFMNYAPSADLQYHVDTCHSIQITPRFMMTRLPKITWLTPEILMQKGEIAPTSRIPHLVVATVHKALQKGPVLFVIPPHSTDLFFCQHCHKQARCNRCMGPLQWNPNQKNYSCLWCHTVIHQWTCQSCHQTTIQMARISIQSTIRDLQNLFKDIPITVISENTRQTQHMISQSPSIVLITGDKCPPMIQSQHGEIHSYHSCVILDAWSSLSATALDAREDILDQWMSIAAHISPMTQQGEVFLIGQCDPSLARSLITWDGRLMARVDNKERKELSLPPYVSTAVVWGTQTTVMECLQEIGALSGDLSHIGDMPSIMGPIPIAVDRNDTYVLDGTNDRVRVIVRAKHTQQMSLTQRLRHVIQKHSRQKKSGELRFCIHSKNLVQR